MNNKKGEEFGCTMLPYGIVGNCNTAALIRKDASIDWMCFPTFASPSIFARILDRHKGGTCRIVPKGTYKIQQQYIPNTAILETVFTGKKARFAVYDFFPRYRKLLKNKHDKLYRQNRLIRIIKPLKGTPNIKIIYEPRPNYAKDECELRQESEQLVTCATKEDISLISNVHKDILETQEYFPLQHTHYLVIGTPDDAHAFTVKHCQQLMNATKRYWERWVRSMTLPEMHKDTIIRSAITLKLLTYSRTGAIIAGASCSIPEQLGTERVFDYRFCWLRDAAMTADALKKIGRDHESKKLIDFIMTVGRKKHLQIMYGINGETDLHEQVLDHLEGFHGTGPPKLGNPAHSQKQNDIYGEIIDIMYLYYAYYEYEKRMPEKYWVFLRKLVREIKKHWRQKDSGIWEFRGKHEHYTHSVMMCYVGIDRAIKIALHFGKQKYADEWCFLRDEILRTLMKHYNPEKKTFTMYRGGNELDASVLLLATHEVLPGHDPRMINTVKTIYKELKNGNLVQRYNTPDDFGKPRSAFTICAFWLVEALWYVGEEEKARKLYNNLLKYGNHVGLFSEDIDIKTKKQLGNFPQGYTHIAIINTSILLSEWSAKRKKIDFDKLPKKRIW